MPLRLQTQRVVLLPKPVNLERLRAYTVRKAAEQAKTHDKKNERLPDASQPDVKEDLWPAGTTNRRDDGFLLNFFRRRHRANSGLGQRPNNVAK